MQNTDLTEKLKRLPEEHQREVADFVDFLLSRTPDTPDATRVLRETAGLWRGETDGITYENTLREQWMPVVSLGL
jgi:mRNA-degrading endonuclease RelE of RelBE toxin-antitoxin system